MTSPHSHNSHNHRRHILEWVVLVLLVAILAGTLYICVSDFEFYRLRGYIRPLHNRHQVLITPEQIQSWMTIRYINVVFHLPANYLKTALKITDTHYPNLTVNTLARQEHQTPAIELVKVISAVNSQK